MINNFVPGTLRGPLATQRYLYSNVTDGIAPGNNGFGGSTAYPVASTAYFSHIYIPYACSVTKFWWQNGATVTGTIKIDMALYMPNEDDPCTATYLCGIGGIGTTQSGTSAYQSTTITGYPIGPGSYWLAYLCDTATNSTNNAILSGGATGKQALMVLGYKEKASVTIPMSSNLATVTLQTIASAFVPCCGIEVTPRNII